MVPNTNTIDSFCALVADAQANPIQGWDFSYVAGRYIYDDPPWAYGDSVLPRIEKATSMLDVDTGGGEFLLALHKRAKHWPESCWAIEAFAHIAHGGGPTPGTFSNLIVDLSEREREILRLLADGLPNGEQPSVCISPKARCRIMSAASCSSST